MVYDTIAQNVQRARVTGRGQLRIREDVLDGVIPEVEYNSPSHPTYQFWIERERSIVLKRTVSVDVRGREKGLVSWSRH